MAALSRFLAHCSPAVVGRLPPRLRFMHRAPCRGKRGPRSVHGVYCGVSLSHLCAVAFHPVLHLPESATSCALSLQEDRRYNSADALATCRHSPKVRVCRFKKLKARR